MAQRTQSNNGHGKRGGNSHDNYAERVTVADCLAGVPPSDVTAEVAVIGCVILNSEIVDDLLLIIKASDFHEVAHEMIWETMIAMHDAAHRIDALTLTNSLRRDGKLESIGGASAIVRFAQSVPNWHHAIYYAQEIRRTSIKRQLLYAASETVRDCTDEKYSPDDCLERHEVRVMEISECNIQQDAQPAISLIQSAMTILESRWSGTVDEKMVQTGYSELDQALGGGLQPGQLAIVAARPGAGKTAFAMNVAENVSCNSHLPTLVVSLEMPALELIDRMLSSVSKVNTYKMKSGNLTSEDRQRIVDAASTLSQSALHVIDTPCLSVSKIGAYARRLKRKSGLRLVVVDYLQLVDPVDTRVNRQEQVAKMSRQLKLLAREIQIPVICLAQLNREIERRSNNRPKLSDLRESGAIEQDADIVMFVHREEMFHTGPEREQYVGLAEIIVEKQRSGINGAIELVWRKEIVRFEEKAASRFNEFDNYNQRGHGYYEPE